jgi:hypothetical protein
MPTGLMQECVCCCGAFSCCRLLAHVAAGLPTWKVAGASWNHQILYLLYGCRAASNCVSVKLRGSSSTVPPSCPLHDSTPLGSLIFCNGQHRRGHLSQPVTNHLIDNWLCRILIGLQACHGLVCSDGFTSKDAQAIVQVHKRTMANNVHVDLPFIDCSQLAAAHHCACQQHLHR